ncbi:MAG: hypothetical protein JWN33_649 [Candidatus Saccharibacteria bacterium]|nr:hypothetical protein [Candidatus Saccharibacteria bacterium]
MRNDRPSIDGFVPRRPGSRLGELHDTKRAEQRAESFDRPLHSGDNVQAIAGQQRPQQILGRSDIDESLRQIDTGEQPKKLSRRERKRLKRQTKPHSNTRRAVKWASILLVIFLILAGAYVAWRVVFASGNIFKGNILDLVQNQPLKEDANGRSNFLILGTSEDDPGHEAGFLTDSMMVMSIDQDKKDVFMVSIPRDLYVDYGMDCAPGSAGKINAFFICVNEEDSTEAEDERLAQTRAFVGDIVGLDIQYAVHVNNTVIKDAVNAVGGVDVDVQGSNGDPGILDRNFDWRCRYKCYLVKYENGVHHLDGEHALFLAMARGDVAPTYGLGNSNFDREKNQQKIIIALKEKAVSTGTLTNLGAVTGLIEALGNNLRTNIETKEIRTLMQLGQDINSKNIQTISLMDEENPVVTTGMYNGASIVRPIAGLFDYSDIQAFLKEQLSSDPAVREKAEISVYNGSGVPGVALEEANKLEDEGLRIDVIENAPAGTYAAVTIYQITADKPATAEKLKSIFGVTPVTTKPPFEVSSTSDYAVVLGKARE